jgi:hypothetical protein
MGYGFEPIVPIVFHKPLLVMLANHYLRGDTGVVNYFGATSASIAIIIIS